MFLIDNAIKRNVIQLTVAQKPAIREGVLDTLMRLAQRRDVKQMLNEHHLYPNHRVGFVSAIVVAAIRQQTLVKPIMTGFTFRSR